VDGGAGWRAPTPVAAEASDPAGSVGRLVDGRHRGVPDPPLPGGVRIRLFGPLEVRTASRTLVFRDFPSRKAKTACEILAGAAGRAVSKDELIEALWGDKLPRNPTASAHHTISLLRGTLAADDGSQPIVTDRGRYRVDLDVAEIDTVHFDALIDRAASEHGSSALAHLVDAVGLVGGAVLEDEMYAPWAAELRERYRRRVQRALLDAARMAMVEDDPLLALRMAERARLESDVVLEEGFALCASALIRLGRRHEARVLIAELEHRMHDEFGATIAPETTLLRTLLRSPAPATVNQTAITVETITVTPIEELPFVGRQSELSRIDDACRRVGDGANETLIVHGGRGIGKSRLLVEATANLPAGMVGRRFTCLPSDADHPLFVVNRLIRSMANEAGRDRVPAPSDSVADAYGRLADLIDDVGPTVLAIDDLQWSDTASLAVLAALARPHAVRSVLVLATERSPADVTAGVDERDRVGRCLPGAPAIELGPLSSSAVGELPIAGAWEETGGHPGLLAACVDAARADGQLGAAAIADILDWVGSPDSVARVALGAAAAIGSRFRVDAVSAALGVSPATLLDILDDPVRRQLIERIGTTGRPFEQEFAFRADLTRRVLASRVAGRRLLPEPRG
jgi:DNA-binding SARP family transcriptional activator